MRLTAIIVFLSTNLLWAANTYSQSAKFSIEMENVTVKEILNEIERNSEFIFIFRDDVVDLDRKVSIRVKAKTIDHILDKLFQSTNNRYEIVDRQVLILKKEIYPPVLKNSTTIEMEDAAQQGIIITGTVKDAAGEAMPGVNIVIKGTSTGVVTNIDGEFQMNVPDENVILTFSFVGYTTTEVQVGTQREFSITLNESATEIDEVVVVGYGTQKKASVVGAIVQANAETLAKSGNTNNLANALTGNLPGVTTILNSGQPGENDPTIIIRARGTWNNSDPLILVDGIERRMNDIDVNEVESVSVLKDASATAVFGVKGSEGVILINTKRGRIGKPVLTLDANASMKILSKMPEKMESHEALMWRNTAIENELAVRENNWTSYVPMEIVNLYLDGPHRDQLIPNTPYKYSEVFPNTDWPKEMLKPLAMSYRVNLNVSGGTDFAKYFGSISYIYDGDILRSGLENDQPYKSKWAYDRVNFRTNLDFNITKTTVFTVNLSGYVGTQYTSWNVNQGEIDVLWTPFYGLAPNDHINRWSDGYWGYTPDINRPNPVAQINNYGLKKNVRTSITSDFALNQNLDFILKGLSASAKLSYDTRFNTLGGVPDAMNAARERWVDPNIIYMDPNTQTYHDYTQGTDYIKGQSGDFEFHPSPVTFYPESFTGLRDGGDFWGNMIPQPYQRIFYQFQLNYNQTFASLHDVGLLALMNREEYVRGNSFPRYREDWVGRVTYSFDGRYSFEANGAYNGSERFARKYRFGFFPSVGVAWTVTNEPFVQNLNFGWLNNLKFRYSIGKTGNDNYSDIRWAYETTWGTQTGTKFGTGGTSPYLQYVETNVGNPDLRWEEAVKKNFGFEISLLKHLITLEVDVFKDDRDGIYMSANQRQAAIPAFFGMPPVAANVGKTSTKGYEIALRVRKSFSDFHPWVNFNYTHAVDKVVYQEDPELLPEYQKSAGLQIDQSRNYLYLGYVNNWDEIYGATRLSTNQTAMLPGEYTMVDFNGDGVIDGNDSNVPYTYPRRPQNTWNMTFGLDYKRWSLMVQFYGVFNASRTASHTPTFRNGGGSLVFGVHRDYWTPENRDASYKVPIYQNLLSNGYSTLYDGAYTRLKSAEISYNADQEWVKRIGLSSVKFYVNGNNLVLWSDWPDDRESEGSRYPMYRTINLGLTIGF